MGNLIRCSGKKTSPSGPQKNGKCDAMQETLLQVLGKHDTRVVKWLQDYHPHVLKDGSPIPLLVVKELEAERNVNCGRHHTVASERRGKKTLIRFHRQTGPFAAMQETACYFLDTCASSVLHECVRLHTPRLIPFFVQDGMDIDEMDTSGLTALHVASKILTREGIQMLLHCGANVNLTAPVTGESALHLATQSSSSKGGITLAAGTECVELLLRNGAKVRVRDKNGKRAIHFACQAGREDLVTLLLDHGADINSLTNLQESPLFLFLEEKINLRHVPLLHKLLSLSYPLKITNAEGCLPKGLISARARPLKDTLLRMTSYVLPLQEICKFNIRKIYGGTMKGWVETKLPTNLWKSIYINQEFSYASKIKAFS